MSIYIEHRRKKHLQCAQCAEYWSKRRRRLQLQCTTKTVNLHVRLTQIVLEQVPCHWSSDSWTNYGNCHNSSGAKDHRSGALEAEDRFGCMAKRHWVWWLFWLSFVCFCVVTILSTVIFLVYVMSVTKTSHVLLFVREKGNELCQNGRVMKGLLFTCYHGSHNVQGLIHDGLTVRPITFNYLGKCISFYKCSSRCSPASFLSPRRVVADHI